MLDRPLGRVCPMMSLSRGISRMLLIRRLSAELLGHLLAREESLKSATTIQRVFNSGFSGAQESGLPRPAPVVFNAVLRMARCPRVSAGCAYKSKHVYLGRRALRDLRVPPGFSGMKPWHQTPNIKF